MRIKIIHSDITKLDGGAIVNSADRSLLGGCGVDGAVHQAAGPELLEECRTLGGCETGQAKVTGAYSLRCKYIIHTVAPTWQGGSCGEGEQLASCYRTCLTLAMEHKCRSICFPLLAAGSRGYPKDKALQVAMKTIDAFLTDHDDYDLKVYLVIYDRSDYQIDPKLAQEVSAHLDRHIPTSGPQKNAGPAGPQKNAGPAGPQKNAEPAADQRASTRRRWSWWPFRRNQARSSDAFRQEILKQKEKQAQSEQEETSEPPRPSVCPPAASNDQVCYSIDPSYMNDMLKYLDEGFSQTLLKLIDEKGMGDVECYKKANIDRRLFSRIRSNPNYQPSKPTILAFAVALELTLEETESLLKRAGFALSHAKTFDVIVEYFISKGCFDILTINEALFYFDQPLLGG